MARKISFAELLAKREQREADKLRIGMLPIPGGDSGLEARMPPKGAVLELYGELAAADTAQEILTCGNHALYACCPQLQDRELQTQLGVQDDPMSIIDALFSLGEQDALGGLALKFLGFIPEKKQDDQQKQPGDTVKN